MRAEPAVAPVFAQETARTHRTVSRIMAILELTAASPDGISLGPLAQAIAAPKSSVHGFARGLVAEGYLREEGGRYFVGPAVAALLARSDEGSVKRTLFRRARAAMARLEAEFDESVMFATMVGQSIVYEMIIESSQLVRYSPPPNVRRPLYPTSSGKCFLAHLGPAKLRAYLDGTVPEQADRERIAAELSEVRRAGFALNRGETLPDITGTAGPVLVGGRVVASIAVAGPSSRFAAHVEVAARAVRDEARALSDQTRSC